jgi:undecaprenyl-diphosphatase
MIEEIIELDKRLFLYLNSLNTPWLDTIMLVITQTYVWVPLYLFLLFFILKDFRNDTWAPVVGIVLAIVFADQITSGLMKPIFERLRPSHDPSLDGLVHTVDGYRGGMYGFASSHAANTFTVATFFTLLFIQKRKWIIALFPWAIIISYTRIYLGVHFPGDIIAGWSIGLLAAIGGFYIQKKLLDLKRSSRNE